ncbi:hypothetical protein A33Q_1160 [Indibacter alkaliphilus LW1]|uniref:Uncharacterized protein n=1 Tax=Indibacter alkaliphilus (strain CCUG 57479 / KCTC 22604 / LW1) TaxID=1189612 RepID=S2E202_INDAL|nr:hypothetical protein A33Q_1160 [Indibacter alkaliphilus LW1]
MVEGSVKSGAFDPFFNAIVSNVFKYIRLNKGIVGKFVSLDEKKQQY